MRRPHLFDRAIRETSLDSLSEASREARALGIGLAEFINLRCDELQLEAARVLLAQKRFERSGT